MNITYLLCLISSFVISAVLGPVLIPFLHKLKFGQEIREEGPKWHMKKSGTPTMGGIIFIIAVAVVGGIMLRKSLKGVMLIYLSLAFGIVGFIDDYIKVVKKRNLGLTEIQKLILQIVASFLFMYLLKINGIVGTEARIPFTGMKVDFGIWYIPICIFFIIGTVNAVNLTDGLDGLATSVTVIVMLFFISAAAKIGCRESAVFAVITDGALLGFLIYNKYPAKIFMGDTGSLFLGGAVAALAVSNGLIFHLIIAGLVYVLETLSVIIQVISFKTTGKRVFKMSPIHHHFEMCGFSERKIVAMFSAVALISVIIAYIGL